MPRALLAALLLACLSPVGVAQEAPAKPKADAPAKPKADAPQKPKPKGKAAQKPKGDAPPKPDAKPPAETPAPEAEPAKRKRDPKFAIVDDAEAAKDPDFHLQGEYFGRMRRADGSTGYEGLQVIALGDGAFDAVHYRGGLPGGGWNRSDKSKLAGQREGDVLVLTGETGTVTIEGDTAAFATPDGRSLGELRRIRRVSPRQDASPPRGAIVLFDGSNVDHFVNGKITEDGYLDMGTEFANSYRDFDLHIEFRLPYMPYARGQQRANSGVYLQSRYEVQVLDSFGLDGVQNECASLYRQRAPDVNMCLPPLRWQTYDINFRAPRFDAEGKKIANARITVLHNGVAVHDDVEIVAKTGAGKPEGPNPLPIKLQNHGNPVVFRNVWIVDYSPAAGVASTR